MLNQENAAQPLLMPARPPRSPWPSLLSRPLILLLMMKLFGNIFKFQLINFSIDDYHLAPNSSHVCGPVPYRPQGSGFTGSINTVLIAAATLLMPALGGLLSDKFFGCLKVITIGAVLQFWVSAAHLTLIKTSLMCRNHSWYSAVGSVLSIFQGFTDPLFLYSIMQYATGPQSRQLLVYLYFLAAVATESIGFVPSVLRYLLRNSGVKEDFEFVGVLSTIALIACTLLIARDNAAAEILRSEAFVFPRFLRLRRFYIIVAGFIPFPAIVYLCRNIFHWKELVYYTGDTNGNVSFMISVGSYELSSIIFCLVGAYLTASGRVPHLLAIGCRVRAGLLVMLIGKLALFSLSFVHRRMRELGHSHATVVQAIYFTFGFIDGIANASADVAMYQLVDCIAQRCAKAMYFGIFLTIWGLGLILSGFIVLALSKLPWEGTHLMPKDGEQEPKFYIRYSIVIGLLLLSIVYLSKVSLPLAEGLMPGESDEEDAEEPEAMPDIA